MNAGSTGGKVISAKLMLMIKITSEESLFTPQTLYLKVQDQRVPEPKISFQTLRRQSKNAIWGTLVTYIKA